MEYGRSRGRGGRRGPGGGRGDQGRGDQGRGGRNDQGRGGRYDQGRGNRGGRDDRGRGGGRGGYDGGGGGRGGGNMEGSRRALEALSLDNLAPKETGAKRGERDPNEPEGAKYDLVRTRPDHLKDKRGTSGYKIVLKTNYLAVERAMESRFYTYRVDVRCDDDRTPVRKKLLAQHKNKLPNYIFDGTVLHTIEPIYPHAQQSNMELSSVYVVDETKPTNQVVVIVIRLVTEVFPTDYQYLQIYNLLKNRILSKLGLKMFNRDYYDYDERKQFDDYLLEIWPGYKTSIRQHEQNLLLNAEIANKFVRMDSLLQQFSAYFNQKTQETMANLKKGLIGSVVLTKYNQKTYRVDDILFDETPLDTFQAKNTLKKVETMTYVEYYKMKYGITVNNLKQPLLLSLLKEKDIRGGRKQHTKLLPELCSMTGQNQDMRSNFRLQTAIQGMTRQDPSSRVRNLTKFCRRLSSSVVKEESENFGIKIASNLLTLNGRVIPSEMISLGSGKKEYPEYDWTFDLKSGLFSSGAIEKWFLIYPRRHESKVETFYQNMRRAVKGLRVDNPIRIPLDDERLGSYMAAIEDVLLKDPHFVFVVVPDDRGDRYGTIKKRLLVTSTIPNQVVTVKKVMSNDHKMLSMATKVNIQMACKVGAEAWAVPIPFKNVMVVGFDTYHDTSRKNMSVGGMVASYNFNLTKYYTSFSTHTENTELSSQIPIMLTQCLRAYYKANQTYPKRIFFYRDGVGEGNIYHVKEVELNNILESFKKITDPSHVPLLTYIIVCKRINTKFFKPDAVKQFVNPPSGTVVDDVVTIPDRYDFFLISQSVRQGTVNPTSYNVIFDQSGWAPDLVQKLTYKLTHLYYNWPGTVRVPAPCQYAHKVAKLVGEHLHVDSIGEKMANVLWHL